MLHIDGGHARNSRTSACVVDDYPLYLPYDAYTPTILCSWALLQVVANFAGTPFADKAGTVVEACAKHGRHYVDITGTM